MSAEDFIKSVDDGIRLSKRLYFGKDRAVAPPKTPPPMERSLQSYLPSSPMVYAVIPDPSIVDNPDIPSYQPHVYGRSDPPALIPLQMNSVELKADCYLDTAFVSVSGTWRVHCVMGSKSCDCRIAVPMGEQGSILGVEVTISRKSYCTQFIPIEEKKDIDKAARVEDGGFLKAHIFTLKVPQVDGGSNISIKICWSQKLLFSDGQYTLNVPFTFPEYVIPAGKKLSKKERIEVNVDAGTESEVLCKTTSHPLKELRRKVGNLGFLYEAEVLSWSNADLNFSYTVSSSHIIGNVLVQSPSLYDVDQREMFCLYLLPGNQKSSKLLRKDVVFVVDISGSMKGKLLEDTKNALSASLHKLGPEDSFAIIAFNSEVYQSSMSLELATPEAIDRATQWIEINFVPGDGTNILNPLNKAVEMLSDCRGSVPIIFLITDGTVEDERHICDVMKSKVLNGRSTHPQIFTFGIGTFCNHHFLRMLATIGRGQYDAAYDVDMIDLRMEALFSRAASTILTDIAIEPLEDLEIEMYPSRIPDLSSAFPLTVFGRYNGRLPDQLKVTGTLADSSTHVIDLHIHKAKDIPLDKVCAKPQIDQLTAQSWLSEDKLLEEKVTKLSMQNSVASEFTRMILQETNEGTKATETSGSEKDPKGAQKKTIVLRNLCVGFGNLQATNENVPPGAEQVKLPEAAEILVKAASNCCGKIFTHCCCMCCIQCCSRLNDQFVIVLTQLCSALACLGCFECCTQICCGGHDG
ncbi:inter-alpha-trypsin inhibitor heavy chain H3 [Punica granatum]|uniref:Inter-alpha-trypsin inhibitor heavy chain H3 n=1 Tax=Punica granatum TaxID=22663 RepID=A0A6P8CPC2_PUNGR|nr:inter-alpha-trypsin inhibitor heavy chain H3 [Punica granatum]